MVYEKNKALNIVSDYKTGWGNTLVEEKPDIRDVAHATLEMRGEAEILTPISYDKSEKRRILLSGFYISIGVALLLVLVVKFKLIKL